MTQRTLILLLLAIGIAPAVHATKNCTITSAPAILDFNTYTPSSSTPDTAVGTITVTCNPNLTATLTMTRGTSSASYLPRTMALGGNLLPYNLYTTSAGNPPPVWGDGSAGTVVVNLVTTPQNKTFTLNIFGIMPINSDVPPGTYLDSVSLTINDDKAGDPDTVTFSVRAIVPAECTISTFLIGFGTYDPVGTHATNPLNATGVINVYCTRTTVGTVQLTAGQWSLGAVRRMRSAGGAFLTYEVYRELGRTTVWNLANTVSGTSTNRTLPINGGFTAYAQIPGNQDAASGTYYDTIQAIVNY